MKKKGRKTFTGMWEMTKKIATHSKLINIPPNTYIYTYHLFSYNA